ncbi:MAG: N-acetylmuramoyl-L-alanine amidase [Candidatus Xenolissoclinum pacificiensis L6]|uniref:N-acetylmuramoyl-L-alanine amidase n=1 Tax=Candidatus Xenolissoclinum pacificiensis L6 TaxID=1401685 RepID=W2V1B1_9RICK|nr:MAG: N-acetylmuramoyl-L-alanine amidase [Candidatus Xenolissoclinum pacificiensis L6]
MKIHTDLSSPNFRARTSEVPFIILHHTVIDLNQTLQAFMNPSSKVSSHYVIAKDGDIHAMVPLQKAAFHAGVSTWKKYKNLNNYSVGIELVNSGYEPFTDNQYISVVETINLIRKSYPIQDSCILSHSDIAPDRKIDVSSYFEWSRLYKDLKSEFACLFSEDISELSKDILYKTGDRGQGVKKMQSELLNFGYPITGIDGIFGPESSRYMRAFNQHFCPEIFTHLTEKIQYNAKNEMFHTISKHKLKIIQNLI